MSTSARLLVILRLDLRFAGWNLGPLDATLAFVPESFPKPAFPLTFRVADEVERLHAWRDDEPGRAVLARRARL